MTDSPIRLPQPIMILSDGTGDTAEKVARAALRQFSDHVVRVRTPHVDSPAKLKKIFRVAVRQKALLVTTLVRRDMRELAARMVAESSIQQVDLLGSLLLGLEGFLNEQASGVPDYFTKLTIVIFAASKRWNLR